MTFDPKEYLKWKYEMAEKRGACLACEQDDYLNDPNTDLEAAMMGSGVYEHRGPYCKRRIR